MNTYNTIIEHYQGLYDPLGVELEDVHTPQDIDSVVHMLANDPHLRPGVAPDKAYITKDNVCENCKSMAFNTNPKACNPTSRLCGRYAHLFGWLETMSYYVCDNFEMRTK